MNHRDALTGALNRSALLPLLTESVNGAQAQGTSLRLLFIDIDHFQRFNGHNGHRLGDMLLKRFVEMVNLLLQGRHSLFRYGGDEFVIVLSNVTQQEASRLAEEICVGSRCSLALQPIHCGNKWCMGAARIGASIGIADLEQNMTAEELLASADRHMYEAKRKGRDCVVWKSTVIL